MTGADDLERAGRGAGRRLGVLLGLAGFLAASCGGEAPGPPPNLVVITLDTTRADHLGLYGYFRDTSPHLDAFADEALVFERCLAPVSVTLPSHFSLLTGTDPHEHGVLRNVGKGLRFAAAPALRSTAELLREGGYHTAAFVAAAPLKRDSGIADGYALFDEPEGATRAAEDTTSRALEWLGGVQDAPFHLWVHYYDAHYPWRAPAPHAGTFREDEALRSFLEERAMVGAQRGGVHERSPRMANAYGEELLHQDAELGRLLDALRERPDWGRTVVVVVGDHGEGLGQHGIAAHGRSTWDEQLRVPLVLRVPGRAATRESATMGLADVLPTLLGQVSIPALEPLLEQASGRDALRSPPASVLSYAVEGRDGPWYGLTTERWKLQLRPGDTVELYDLAQDPFELSDVAAAHPDVASRLRAELEERLAGQRSRGAALGAGSAPGGALGEGVRAELEDLGYTGED